MESPPSEAKGSTGRSLEAIAYQVLRGRRAAAAWLLSLCCASQEVTISSRTFGPFPCLLGAATGRFGRSRREADEACHCGVSVLRREIALRNQ